VEVWQHHGLMKDELIGFTEIDMEERHFSEKWQSFEKKPIEKRALKQSISKGSFGHVSCWAELISQKQLKKPSYDIRPPEKLECELRAVVWETMDVAFKDQTTKCNDLFCKGRIGSHELETDTHWRCRAKGSFNWRMKFPYSLPLNPQKDYGMDIFKVQLFDRDIVHSNEMICEAEINLNSHKMLDKVYKRKLPVMMKKKNQRKGRPHD